MPPISIIAIGRDGITMSKLMNEFRVYAQRFQIPFGDLKIARSHRDGTFVEANSLLMATNGVCFIGDWSSYNVSCSAYIKNGKLNSGQQWHRFDEIVHCFCFHQYWIRVELSSMHKQISISH